MSTKSLTLLKTFYKIYKETDNRSFQKDFSQISPDEGREFRKSLNYLSECGYIAIYAARKNVLYFDITVEGIEFCDNGFTSFRPSPILQGSNNIYINGSNNAVIDNFNSVSLDIQKSELPDNTKDLLNSLLYELKNPHLSNNEKSSIVKKFLFDVSSGTISNTVASTLSTLLTSLFAHLM